eukprot:gene15928-670_t
MNQRHIFMRCREAAFNQLRQRLGMLEDKLNAHTPTRKKEEIPAWKLYAVAQKKYRKARGKSQGGKVEVVGKTKRSQKHKGALMLEKFGITVSGMDRQDVTRNTTNHPFFSEQASTLLPRKYPKMSTVNPKYFTKNMGALQADTRNQVSISGASPSQLKGVPIGLLPVNHAGTPLLSKERMGVAGRGRKDKGRPNSGYLDRSGIRGYEKVTGHDYYPPDNAAVDVHEMLSTHGFTTPIPLSALKEDRPKTAPPPDLEKSMQDLYARHEQDRRDAEEFLDRNSPPRGFMNDVTKRTPVHQPADQRVLKEAHRSRPKLRRCTDAEVVRALRYRNEVDKRGMLKEELRETISYSANPNARPGAEFSHQAHSTTHGHPQKLEIAHGDAPVDANPTLFVGTDSSVSGKRPSSGLIKGLPAAQKGNKKDKVVALRVKQIESGPKHIRRITQKRTVTSLHPTELQMTVVHEHETKTIERTSEIIKTIPQRRTMK